MLHNYCISKPHLNTIHKDPRSPIPLHHHFLVDEKHKLVLASLPKVGSSFWNQLFVVVAEGGQKPRDVYYAHDQDYLFQHGIRLLSNYTEKEQSLILDTYFKVLVVRHPVDRLISAYFNKFINGPMEHETARSVAYINSHYKSPDHRIDLHNLTVPIRLNISLGEFVRLVSDPESPYNQHWDSYQNLASPCGIHYDYIIKLESHTLDAPKVIDIITDGHPEIVEGSIGRVHSLRSSPGEESLQVVKDLSNEISTLTFDEMHTLVEVVKGDMEMFGYNLDLNEGVQAVCSHPDLHCC